jgi:hypothetical protein
MKTRNLLTALGVAAFAAITINALLSPRHDRQPEGHPSVH